MIPPRTINSAGLALLKNHEKCVLRAYLDSKKKGGTWTIGWGHTGNVHDGDFISQVEADRLLLEDLAGAERAVSSCVRVPLNENQFSALVDFAFNEGAQTFFESSILTLLNQGDYRGACEALALYDKWHVQGVKVPSVDLKRRREEEQSLFMASVGP